jgi:acetyltransferase
VGWGDLITWLGDDPETHSIVIYTEAIGEARTIFSAAREVALTRQEMVPREKGPVIPFGSGGTLV